MKKRHIVGFPANMCLIVGITWSSTSFAQPTNTRTPGTDEPETATSEPQNAQPSLTDVEELKRQNRLLAERIAALEVAREAEPDIEALRQRNEDLELRIEDLESSQEWHEQRLDQALSLSSRVSGYIDFGLFYVGGDGRGIRSDLAGTEFPEYVGVVPGSWVFMGDPLSTAINSRGDPADVAESRAVAFNQIGNGGKSSFILNAINLQLFAGVGDNLTINGMIDFLPRARDISNPDGQQFGDFVDVKLGYVEYRPEIEWMGLSLFAGKFDSVVGREYRSQEAPDRITVTPSLICRYTCGRPLGLKARGVFFDGYTNTMLAVTNGSNFTEGFPFNNEIDQNNFKTVSGRAAVRTDPETGIELGVSGAFGAQDAQTDDGVTQWHIGADLFAEWGDFQFSAEYVKGKAEGSTEALAPTCGTTPCIDYEGAYGLVAYRVTNWFVPYGRVDWRSALHQNGASFVYISDLMRITPGMRFELGTNVVVKAEYSINQELERVPAFPNDVFTSSLVARY